MALELHKGQRGENGIRTRRFTVPQNSRVQIHWSCKLNENETGLFLP